MEFISTAIPDVKIVQAQILSDVRGFFMETFRSSRFIDEGIRYGFVQDNHSGSRQYVLRGLHYQVARPQGKLVRAVTGEVFDVAVDLRRASPTFGRWIGEVLSAEKRNMLWIPPGFAHGFLVLSAWADVLYKTTEYYDAGSDRTLIWNDRSVGILWPLPQGVDPIISIKDAAGLPLGEAEAYA